MNPRNKTRPRKSRGVERPSKGGRGGVEAASERRGALVEHAVERVRIGNKRGSPPLAALALPREALLGAARAHLIDREPVESIARRLGIVRPPVTGATPRGRKAGAQRRAAEHAKRAGKVAQRTLATWLGKVRKEYDRLVTEAHEARLAAYGPFERGASLKDVAEDLMLRSAAWASRKLSGGDLDALDPEDKANVIRVIEAVSHAPKVAAEAEHKQAQADKTRRAIDEELAKLTKDGRPSIPRGEAMAMVERILLGEDAARLAPAPGRSAAKATTSAPGNTPGSKKRGRAA